MGLNKSPQNSLPWGRFFAAAVGGLLLSAGFAPLGIEAAAWIGPGVILFSALGTANGRAFQIGYVGGMVHFVSSLYWLIHMPFTWHGIPLAPAAGWLALSAYCALFPAIWVWLCWKLLNGTSLSDFLATPRLRRIGWALAAGALWTALEYVRGLFLTGFPWNFVGASQYHMLPLIQIASITGIYGVSFLVVWTSVSLADATLRMSRQPSRQSMWANAGLPLLVVIGTAGYGVARISSFPQPARELKVAMIQPSIPQTLIWDPEADKARFQDVLSLSAKALAEKPQLLLWPESAVPDLTAELQQTIGQLARQHHAWIVFCASTSQPTTTDAPAFFNSALLCNPDGDLESVYNKRRLVIFGEYVPLSHWLPFLKWLTSVGYDLTPGERPVDFQIENPSAKISALICFEDMFPQEARAHVGPDTDFLVNLTNDGWFGHGPEQWQQAASGIFRAIENGVPLVRCTNDGLTCWADACGRVRQIFGQPGNVYGPGFMTAEIPLRSPGDHSQTFYNLHGDWFPLGCASLGLAALILPLTQKRPVPPSSIVG